jgi:hypothetical protein
VIPDTESEADLIELRASDKEETFDHSMWFDIDFSQYSWHSAR